MILFLLGYKKSILKFVLNLKQAQQMQQRWHKQNISLFEVIKNVAKPMIEQQQKAKGTDTEERNGTQANCWIWIMPSSMYVYDAMVYANVEITHKLLQPYMTKMEVLLM
jgi:hypothetical protein